MQLPELPFQIDYTIVGLVLLYIFGATAFVHLLFYLITFRRLAFYKETPGNNEQPPVSIIICAKNEAENLRQFLEPVLQQNYKHYQVIVVNDCSWDETEEYLEAVQKQYPALLKVINLQEQERYKHGKKFALAIGIKGAQFEHLLLTDADCKPSGPDWLSEMMCGYQSKQSEFVIGYGAYMKEGGILNKWIRFDTAYNGMQYLSYAIAGKPYMGVGRNLSYKKDVFFRSKGFASHAHVMSGDDDLFVNENANTKNTAVRINRKAFTLSKAKTTFNNWYRQKKRHISTSKYYKTPQKLKLGFYYFTTYLFWMMSALLLSLQIQWMYVTGALVFVLGLKWFITGKSFQKLNESDLIIFYPFFELFSLFIYPFLKIGSRFKKEVSWK